MIKELYLPSRTVYTFISLITLSILSGLGFSFLLGILVFVGSFFFQYAVLYWVLKKSVTIPKERRRFLIIWGVVFLAGIVLSGFMMPTIEEINRNPHLIKQMWWQSVFVLCCSAFIAMTCTRRAFADRGELG